MSIKTEEHMNDMINEAFNANAINAFNPYILARVFYIFEQLKNYRR